MKLGTRKGFIWIYPLILGGIALLYKYVNPLEGMFFPKCPLKTVTGLDCPGCGGQRAAHLLLNGEFKLAFLQNPLLFFFIPYLLIGFYLQLVPEPTVAELRLRRLLYGQRALIIIGIMVLFYTVYRNVA